MAWTPKPNKDTGNPVELPDGWKECDGSRIVGGIWDGQYTPNINGEERFLRGSYREHVLDIEDDQVNLNPNNDKNLCIGARAYPPIHGQHNAQIKLSIRMD